MKVTHLQSSTQIIHLGDVKILCDPWLTDGEYYGSWYHYPPFEESNLARLEYDFIYVSHIHPDHLSEETFRRLPKKKPVLIHNYSSKFVKRKIELLGYDVIECDHGVPYKFNNSGSITIYAADNCNPELCGKYLGCATVETKFGSTQIDTLCAFSYDEQTILNTNDCPFELAETTIKDNFLDKNVSLLLVGYGGAGPYPQCFKFDDVEEKRKAAKTKEKQFLDQAIRFISLIKPKIFAPFAGTYILGSRLSSLTEFYGVPSLDDALTYLNDQLKGISKGILLKQLDMYCLTKDKLIRYDQPFQKSYSEYLKQISTLNLTYDGDEWNDDEISDLIKKAYDRFKSKANEIDFNSKTTLVIQSDKTAYQLSTNKQPTKILVNMKISEPFVRITLHHNLLNRLLRGPRFAHWNNAEIGSHLSFDRNPNSFERGLYHCLCFLHQ